MRLYLSSYLWGSHPEKLFAMVGGPRIGLITNSADQFPEEGIVKRLQDDVTFLQSHGFNAERLDLRDYFTAPDKLEAVVRTFDLLWVRGANVFILRRAMRQSGLDVLVKKLLAEDAIAYGGYSAGACALGSTLRGLELVDDAQVAPAGYDADTIWDGLGVLPYAIAPHFHSDHPESADIDKAIAYFTEHSIPYKALQDGQAIYVNGEVNEIIS